MLDSGLLTPSHFNLFYWNHTRLYYFMIIPTQLLFTHYSEHVRAETGALSGSRAQACSPLDSTCPQHLWAVDGAPGNPALRDCPLTWPTEGRAVMAGSLPGDQLLRDAEVPPLGVPGSRSQGHSGSTVAGHGEAPAPREGALS